MKLFTKIFLLTVVEIAAISAITYWSKDSKNRREYLWFGIIGYVAVAAILAWILQKSSELVVSNTWWQMMNVAIMVLVGIFAFNESLNTYQWAGVVLAISSIVAFAIGDSD